MSGGGGRIVVTIVLIVDGWPYMLSKGDTSSNGWCVVAGGACVFDWPYVVSPSFATSALAFFATSALGTLHLGIFRHVGVETLTPSCLLTRRHSDPYTFVSFDTSVLGSHSLRVFLLESDRQAHIPH